jgi:hypothetical protein
MLGWGAVALPALLLGQGTTELEAGAELGLSAGQAPGLTTTAENEVVVKERQSQLRLSATPLVGARWNDESNELRGVAATRMLWRPVPYSDQRPIFLETLEVTHSARPSKRSGWQLDLRSTYGEEDYTSLLRQFGANQPTLPAALSMFTVNALGDGSWRTSRRTTLSLVVSGTYRRALDDIPAVGATPPAGPLGTRRRTVSDIPNAGSTTLATPFLPPQTLVMVTPAVRYSLDRRTSLEIAAGIGDTDISRLGVSASERVNILTFQPQVGLIRDLARAQQLRLFAGLTYALVLSNSSDNRDWRTLTPVLRGDLASVLWRTPASSLRSLLGLEAAWYADPVLGFAVWRTIGFANVEAQLGPRWGAALRASFTTDLNGPVSVGDTPLDETIAQVDLPFRYRWSSQLVVETGVRYSERAPNLFADRFAWHYRELWAFVTLSGTTHRTRTRAAPTARPAGSPIPGTPPPASATSTTSDTSNTGKTSNTSSTSTPSRS